MYITLHRPPLVITLHTSRPRCWPTLASPGRLPFPSLHLGQGPMPTPAAADPIRKRFLIRHTLPRSLL